MPWHIWNPTIADGLWQIGLKSLGHNQNRQLLSEITIHNQKDKIPEPYSVERRFTTCCDLFQKLWGRNIATSTSNECMCCKSLPAKVRWQESNFETTLLIIKGTGQFPVVLNFTNKKIYRKIPVDSKNTNDEKKFLLTNVKTAIVIS